MKVVIRRPTEQEITSYEISDEGIEIEPVFYQPKGRATAAVIEVARRDGEIVFRGLLTISGKTGSAEVTHCTKPVMPDVDVAVPPRKAKKE